MAASLTSSVSGLIGWLGDGGFLEQVLYFMPAFDRFRKQRHFAFHEHHCSTIHICQQVEGPQLKGGK
jgi:hypothetical protein